MQPYLFTKQDEEREKNWKEYLSIYSKYVDYYHDQLLKNEKLSNARDYLKNRSLGKNEVKKFKIGFIDKNPSFFNRLKKKFSEKTLIESGLFYFDDKKKKMCREIQRKIDIPDKQYFRTANRFGWQNN